MITDKFIIKVVKDALEYLEKRIKVSDVVSALEKNTEAVVRVGEKIKPVPAVDLTPVLAKLDKLVPKEVKERPVVSLDVVQAQLSAILTAIEGNKPEMIGPKIDALDAVFSGLKPKESVKFDDVQMKGLMAALTGSRGFGSNAGTKTATSWSIKTIAITLADTEYEYSFPANTISWTMKLRGSTGKLYYATETGKLPGSGDNSEYITLPAKGTRSQDNVEYGGNKIYVESDLADQVVEIDIFTL